MRLKLQGNILSCVPSIAPLRSRSGGLAIREQFPCSSSAAIRITSGVSNVIAIRIQIGIERRECISVVVAIDRMRTGKRNRHRRPDSPDHPKSKRDDISINQLT
ncbi:hypothetical protein EVAR_13428_1 [Eumeta japonica]|uniref:Uncharacterized protein n=1 Tax=Eumeta variegata TaxID=151549 RepID=A0A4C1V6M8_EUMVA|nr:hypothetical protein EVAR_13428_1 [Eumeta japonica]